MSEAKPAGVHLGYIDGLRGIAVTIVVGYHCGLPIFHGGFVGVDVFFVISGFLITGILFDECAATGSINFVAFYARRVRRLFPSLLLVLLSTLALAALLLSPAQREVQEVARAAIAASLYSSNIYFDWWLRDYFGGPSEFQPLLHTWSLGVEEQFYLFWPVLIWLAAARGRRSRSSLTKALLITSALILSASLVASIVLRTTRPDLVFFWTPFRVWEFAIGAILAIWPSRRVVVWPTFSNSLAWIGLGAIGLSAVWIMPGEFFPVPLALLPVMGTAFIILGHVLTPHPAIDRVIASPPALWIGRVSYPWYLWHFPLLAIARLTLLEPSPIRDTAIGLLSLLIADVTERFIERPLRFRILPKFRSGTVLAGGLVSSVVVACVATILGLWAQSVALSGSPAAGDDSLPAASSLPTIETPAARIFVIGDSHAGVLEPAIRSWSGARHDPIDVVFLMETGCPPLRRVTPVLGGYAIQDCPRANDAHYATIAESIRERDAGRGPKNIGVVLAARWTAYLLQPNISVYEPWVGRIDRSVSTRSDARRMLEAKLDNEISDLASRSARVLLILSPPELKFPLEKCLGRLAAEKCAVTTSDYLSQQAVIREIAAHMVREFPQNLRVFDPLPSMCPGMLCKIKVNEQPAYIDTNHLSATGALALLPSMTQSLDWLSGLEARQ